MIIPWDAAELCHLPEEDGHRVAYWAYGNPDAPALLLLHGGPGGGCSPGLRALFDPSDWRLVAMDQRGAGQSTPHAGRDLAALEANRTADLIHDIERLRARLGLAQWALFGGSWGVTLAQAYTHAHPGRVSGHGAERGHADPRGRDRLALWSAGHAPARGVCCDFRAMAPEAAPGQGLVEAYRALLCKGRARRLRPMPGAPGRPRPSPPMRITSLGIAGQTRSFAWALPGLSRITLPSLPGSTRRSIPARPILETCPASWSTPRWICPRHWPRPTDCRVPGRVPGSPC